MSNNLVTDVDGNVFCLVQGTDGDDQLFGNQVDHEFRAGAGNDVVNAGIGNDRIFGDAGDDDLRGNRGDDTIEGGEGNDRVAAGAGEDMLDGGDGNDNLLGGSGNDALSGGAGDDMLRGGTGSDVANGGVGNDTFLVRDGELDNDVVNGGTGLDTLRITVDPNEVSIADLTAEIEAYLAGDTSVATTLFDGELTLSNVERVELLINGQPNITLAADDPQVDTGDDDMDPGDDDVMEPTGSLVVDVLGDTLEDEAAGNTLREAIEFASTLEDGQTITFDPDAITGAPFRLVQGFLDIEARDLTIDGDIGRGRITISGDVNGDDVMRNSFESDAFASDAAGVFDDNVGIFYTDATDLTIKNLRLTGGDFVIGTSDNYATTRLEDVEIVGNREVVGSLYGTSFVEDSTVSRNLRGLYVDFGSVSNTDVVDNGEFGIRFYYGGSVTDSYVASNEGVGISGGFGLEVDGTNVERNEGTGIEADGGFRLTNSFVAFNHAGVVSNDIDGENGPLGGATYIANSTILRNDDGVGVDTNTFSTVITSSTIADNVIALTGSLPDGTPLTDDAGILIENSIILGNDDNSLSSDASDEGVLRFAGVNLIGDNSDGASGFDASVSDSVENAEVSEVFEVTLVGGDEVVDVELISNEFVLPLLEDASNPALDRVAPSDFETDERGEPRAFDQPGIGEPGLTQDLGAFEVQNVVETVVIEDPDTGVLQIFGTDARDELIGTDEAEQIFGFGGSDIINGMGGDDEIEGGSFNDTIRGGTGADTILGGSGQDTIRGDGGNDLIVGGADADNLDGGGGNDHLIGDEMGELDEPSFISQADRLNGGGGNDLLEGGVGDDRLFGGGGNDMLFGGEDNDTLQGDRGSDMLFGEDGNDLFIFREIDVNDGSSVDVADGGDGDDVVRVTYSTADFATADVLDEIADYFSAGTSTQAAIFNGTLEVSNVEEFELIADGNTIIVDANDFLA